MNLKIGILLFSVLTFNTLFATTPKVVINSELGVSEFSITPTQTTLNTTEEIQVKTIEDDNKQKTTRKPTKEKSLLRK